MASNVFSAEDFSCSVCYDIFSEPVVLLCSHTFCKGCLKHFWEEKGCQECPLCRKISQTADPPCNLALKKLCETFLIETSQQAVPGSKICCNLHHEELKLFCLNDQKPVCVVCRDSNQHKSHNFHAANEAAVDLKEEIRSKLMPIQEKLRAFEEVRRECVKTTVHMQAEQTEKQIKEVFLKLHQFLQAEEAARIEALREEKEKKRKIMEKKIEDLQKEIRFLGATIRTINEQIQADDIKFLQKYKATLKRTQCKLKDPEILSGTLIDVAKHLGNLKFRVWEKMKNTVTYTTVTLDPNTAHTDLQVSPNLTSVTLRPGQQACPENPERFSYYQVLLGSEGFGSGVHSWDVEVGKCEEWALGICTVSAQRGDQFLASGVWRLWYSSGIYRADSAGNRYISLRVKKKPGTIRVYLDWNSGQVSFYDPLNKTHLHTFKHKFTEKIYPTFANGSPRHSLSILPLRVSFSLDIENLTF